MPSLITSSTMGGTFSDARKTSTRSIPAEPSAFRGSLRRFEIGIALEAVHFFQPWIDGENAVALHDEIAADVVAGAPGLVAHADDSDGLGLAKHFVDERGIVHIQGSGVS